MEGYRDNPALIKEGREMESYKSCVGLQAGNRSEQENLSLQEYQEPADRPCSNAEDVISQHTGPLSSQNCDEELGFGFQLVNIAMATILMRKPKWLFWRKTNTEV